MLTVTTSYDVETISASANSLTATVDLSDHLFDTASDDYAEKVLNWWQGGASQPFEIANGRDTETWQWKGDPS